MFKTGLSYIRFVEVSAVFLLILYPGLMFAVKGGMNGAFLFLLLLSLCVLIYRPHEMSFVVWDREMVFYLFAMAALPIAIFFSQSYHQHYSAHPYDAASRYLLAIPVFMFLRRVNFDVVAKVQYGFPLAAIIGCLMLEPQIQVGRYGISTLDLIHFGDFELLLGVLSALSINWAGQDNISLRFLKIIGLLAGIFASIASGSRGGWVALPLFLAIFFYFNFGKISLKALMTMLLLLSLSGFITYTFSQKIQIRVDEVINELRVYHHGNLDTSTGMRLQIYQAAIRIFVHNPVFGIGPEGFAHEMDVMQKAGEITHIAAEAGKDEVHNDILSKTAEMGIFGLIALLSVYLVPLRVFYTAKRSPLLHIRQAGLLGFTFVGGFMVFGLTVDILNLTMATAFYSLTVAVLMAACLNRGYQVETLSKSY